MVGSTSTFVSCKDYDDDIDGLQEQIDANKKQIDDILAAINGKKFIESYAPVEGGYLEEFYKLKYCSTVVYMVPRA